MAYRRKEVHLNLDAILTTGFTMKVVSQVVTLAITQKHVTLASLVSQSRKQAYASVLVVKST